MKRGIAAGLLTFAMIGCGASSGSTTGSTQLRLEGSVASTRTLDNARVAAVAPDGTTFWAYVDAKGAFQLDVPTGLAYRLLLANARATGGERVIGHLVIHTSRGPSRWLSASQGGTLALGTLRPAGTTAPTTPTTTTTKDLPGADSSGGDSTSSTDSSGGDDFESHESDHIGLCTEHDGSEADADVELDADTDPGDAYADDAEQEHDAEAEGDDDGHACATPAPTPAPTSTSTAPAPSSPPPAPTSTSTTPAPVPSTCIVNADCGAGYACVASTCVVSLR